MEKITLLVEGVSFEVSKAVLCEHSDYFRAMFSGSYVENEQREVKIDVVDAKSMKLILQYMEHGFTLGNLPLTDISTLTSVANFLQVTELIEQIEKSLDSQLCASNCMEIMDMAENMLNTKLKQLSAAIALTSFDSIKLEYFTSLDKLRWYLSHPYLYVENELDIFKFGLQWILQNDSKNKSVLTILGCLDVKRLTTNDLNEMKTLVKDFVDNPAVRVVDCLYELCNTNHQPSVSVVLEQKDVLCHKFTDTIYNDVFNLVKESKTRQLKASPIIPIMSRLSDENGETVRFDFIYEYNYNKSGLNKWLEIPPKDLWGWRIVAWGLTKLVLVCGKYKSSENDKRFMRDVMVYDTLRKKWTSHGVELPPREYGGVAVLRDSLYIMGGKGEDGEWETGIIYDLNLKTFREIPKIPEETNSAVLCVHENAIYASYVRNIYRFEQYEETGRWVCVLRPHISVNCRAGSMVSFGGYIYCTQRYFPHIFRFKPDVDMNLERFAYFNYSATTMCTLANRLLAFTNYIDFHTVTEVLAVEEYKDTQHTENATLLWSLTDLITNYIRFDENAVCCSLVAIDLQCL